MRKYEISNSMPYEREMYDRLEKISYSDLTMMIENNRPLNQSASYKYRRIIYFINLLFNKYNRPEIAIKLIDRYWKKLTKQELLEGLFIYCDFEVFKKYWKQNRTELSASFLSLIFRTDEITRVEWILSDTKFNKIIDDEKVEYIAAVPTTKWKYFNAEAYNMLVNHPTVTQIALDNGYESLYPESVKDIFLF